MKNLIIGIDQTTNIQNLLDEGVRQFYFGFIPQEYVASYATQTSLNRRYRLKEQFFDEKKAFEVIECIHKQKGIIYLALNSFTSNAMMQKYSQEIYELFKNRVDGIIVANISIATMLKNQNYKNIIISNLFGVYSVSAVKFFIEHFAPVKIILPRDITLSTLQTIVQSYPNMLFECFLYGDNCRFSESFCFSEHGFDSVGFGSLCSYAAKEARLVDAPLASYKQLIKNPKYTQEEKKELLHVKYQDINSLLDKIEFYSYEFDSAKIAQALAQLNRYDKESFFKDKQTYIRATNILKKLEFESAKEIVKKLDNFTQQDEYKIFHNLNTKAIQESIRFFDQFENIVSYKIPSRGREFYKYMLMKTQEAYNYKESQYDFGVKI